MITDKPAVAFCLVSSDHGALIVNRLDYNHSFNGDYYGVGAQILETGRYDARDVVLLKELLAVRRAHFGDGVVALDGGANIGVHALEWARLMRGWGSVIAIEAQERLFYALSGNLVLQNCFNARAIWAALDGCCGTLSFPEPDYLTPSSFGSFELQPRVGGEFIGQPLDYGKADLTVRTITIDSLALPRLDLMKFDLEGMEEAALRGAADTLARCKPIVFAEIIKSNPAALSVMLGEAGYRLLPHGMNMLAIHRDDPTLQSVEVEAEG